MKVLILHQHFNKPEIGGPLRSYYLAKALINAGIEVSVITAGKQREYQRENYKGLELHSLPVAYDNRFGFYKRGFSFISFALRAVTVAAQIPHVDYVYAMSVPLTVGQSALWIQRRQKIPFFFEVGDLWPDAPVEMGFIQNPLLKRSLYLLERQIYHKAKRVVALSDPIRDRIMLKTQQKNVEVVPNMSDTSFFQVEQKDPRIEQKYAVENKFVVSYIGALGFANGLDYLLECARASAKAGLPIQFIICGDGAEESHLKSAIAMLSLTNVKLVGFANRDRVKELMNITDLVFVSYKPFPILETGSPNKYFDGLACGKPIVTNFKGWISDEISREKCGVPLDPQLPQSFVREITPLLSNKSEYETMSRNARALAEKKYSREILGRKFVSLFGR